MTLYIKTVSDVSDYVLYFTRVHALMFDICTTSTHI